MKYLISGSPHLLGAIIGRSVPVGSVELSVDLR